MYVLYVSVCITCHILCISCAYRMYLYVSFAGKTISRADTYNTYRYIQICTRYAQDTCKIHTKYMQIHTQNLRDAAVHICMYCMYHVCIMYVFWGSAYCIWGSAYRMYLYVSACICMYCSHGFLLNQPCSTMVCICMYLYVSVCISMYLNLSVCIFQDPYHIMVCICMYLYVLVCIYIYVCI